MSHAPPTVFVLAPNGRLQVVGAILEPIPVAVFSLILQQRSVSGSPSGSSVTIETMLGFASRHNIAPQTEHFPMSHINEAFARLEAGKAPTASCWMRISEPHDSQLINTRYSTYDNQ